MEKKSKPRRKKDDQPPWRDKPLPSGGSTLDLKNGRRALEQKVGAALGLRGE